jgi:hypothetical protein
MQLSLFISHFMCAFLDVGMAADTPLSKPAVIMVPGAFHLPQVFDKVKRQLSRANYKFLDTVALPSVGHVVGRQADIEAVKSVLCERFRKRNLLPY